MSVVAVTGIVTFKKLFASHADDWVDKLSHIYSVLTLVIFATVLTTSQFVGDPIHCWCPAEFTGAYETYTKSYCWIKNTYFIPISDMIPIDTNVRSNAEITYYQWVPIILLFEAFLFKFPNIIWKMLNTHTGLNMSRMVALGEKALMSNKDERQTTIKDMAIFMNKWLSSHHYTDHSFVTRTKSKVSRFLCIVCSKNDGRYLTALYFNVKLLYVANAIGQFYLLGSFLGMDFNTVGYQVLGGDLTMESWRESRRFPRVTLCDFRIRQLQNILRYTVQCVLPINLFNEKVFITIWFWCFVLAIITCVNLVQWFLILVLNRNNYRFVRKYLKISNQVEPKEDKKLCKRFAEHYLRDDGCFVLRIIAKNSSDSIVIDLMVELWNLFRETTEKMVRSRQKNGGDDYPDIGYIDEEQEEAA